MIKRLLQVALIVIFMSILYGCKKENNIETTKTVTNAPEEFFRNYFNTRNEIIYSGSTSVDFSKIQHFFSSMESFDTQKDESGKTIAGLQSGNIHCKGYTTNVSVEFIAADQTTGEYTYKVVEHTQYKTDVISLDGNSISPAYETEYTIVVLQKNNEYKIVSVVNLFDEYVKNYVDKKEDIDMESQYSMQKINPGNDTYLPMAYNRTNAINYANQYVFNNNPAYYYWGGQGGDCTNFISQCMYAGGWPFVNGTFNAITSWWYKPGKYQYPSHATSWPSAHGFFLFLKNTPTRVKLISKYMNLQPGDIIQIQFEGKQTIGHSTLVTQKSVDDLFVTYHSGPQHDRPLSDMLTSWPGAKFYYWSVK